ncbi:hypothetical protein HMN09_00284700 [Mycena chlorophos]|uniref:Polysaccharide lyase 14 domain-containing protein n=1 Tax=Mycena chlorophos TaxID=658473 RepID=A0A8H6TLI5_MYCCL|nr:hypothetical protein HMN09_00284700 [Mycena chlorophos]
MAGLGLFSRLPAPSSLLSSPRRAVLFLVLFAFAIFMLFSALTTTNSVRTLPSQPENTESHTGTTNTHLPTTHDLFPTSQPLLESWTTRAGLPGALPLSDATFKPFGLRSGTPGHPYTTTPDGRLAMQATYPKGSFHPSALPRGGFGFYAPGPDALDITTAKEALFSYAVLFPEGFDFVKGGKLPGLYGGDDPKTAVKCSGGRRDSKCFSMRLMFRRFGAGELYTYIPRNSSADGNHSLFSSNAKICDLPHSVCNPTYGISIGRGQFNFTPGEWTTVSERVRLNTAGQADGEMEVFKNGESVINATGLVIRGNDAGRIRGMHMETFFGGNTSEWATPTTQKAFFADFSMAILEKL